ncbi:hypothetical protein PMI07_000095 [Rhizobium sp. CF080]|uniref:DUF6414 family protein n=1 Tax=Rhizobium sp. (strain CF080) TaxID=1144310 RepID=UPI0002718009|nr:hypothetical protein [Rhizobium sp. CF080]EUB97535.1 hypothetical protein PMI07_000095 [Rhizobium sp. CF080]
MVSWYRRLFGKRTIHPVEPESTVRPAPLREFVYLDEVSLRSLLSSQVGGVTDSTSEQKVASDLGEFQAKLASDVMVAKSEVNSRFQTSNSSTLQTSRKATVQSWFREFYDKPGLRLVEPISDVVHFTDLEDVKGCRRPSAALSSENLQRGILVEFKVKLSADRVFHLGTLVSEFIGMAKDYPRIFAAGNSAVFDVEEAEAVGKLLQRLLAGLIPIRGEAVEYCVIEVGGIEYVVHQKAIANLDVETKPLVLVGVTEHLAYWKDIRRVLFSDAEFTMLGRVSKSGLQESWMPVKLADLMKDIAPDLVDHINSASRISFSRTPTVRKENVNEVRLGLALHHYVSGLLTSLERSLGDEEFEVVSARIEELRERAETVSGQRSAFGAIGNEISAMIGQEADADLDAKLRESARNASGLTLFPSQTKADSSSDQAIVVDAPVPDERFLDVEIVAMYW